MRHHLSTRRHRSTRLRLTASTRRSMASSMARHSTHRSSTHRPPTPRLVMAHLRPAMTSTLSTHSMHSTHSLGRRHPPPATPSSRHLRTGSRPLPNDNGGSWEGIDWEGGGRGRRSSHLVVCASCSIRAGGMAQHDRFHLRQRWGTRGAPAPAPMPLATISPRPALPRVASLRLSAFPPFGVWVRWHSVNSPALRLSSRWGGGGCKRGGCKRGGCKRDVALATP
mmetsp:Transcript_33732/g.76361  ORF Transcript_33732/g.76361 Transcript_33732/m.76361 type:complete len:224 (-) Transcript_33732:417-1088(-)